jgi:hypothetical protein
MRSVFIRTVLFATFTLIIVSASPVARGAVIINEIAWMGTPTGANDEWMELFNSGDSAVSVDGWTLTDNASLLINLSGTIDSGAYAVLERTDDDTAPGPAFLIYTGALGNGGATLMLKRDDGSIEDQVAGGSNWENVGGDNATKETAQRTNAGWVTAKATPGAQNASVGTQNPGSGGDTDGEKNSDVSAAGASNKTEAQAPVKSLKITAPHIAYVNQPVEFDVTPSGSGERFIRYSWNFGDTHTADVKSPAHAFRHAGMYVVVVESRFLKETKTARTEITVLPASLSLARTVEGHLQMHNNAKYEIDLSGFIIRGEKEFTIPKRTIILPSATLTAHRTLFESGPRKLVSVHDPAGATLASLLSHETGNEAEGTKETVATLMMEEGQTTSEVEQETLTETAALYISDALPNPEDPMVLRPEQAALVTESEFDMETLLPYLGLVVVFVAGLAGLYARKGMPKAGSTLS